MHLEDFNRAPADEAAALARTWAHVPRWAADAARRRPFASPDELAAHVRRAARGWGAEDLDGALAHHARIGETPRGSGPEDAASRREQAGLSDADEEVRSRLADANARYAARFGRTFLVRAAGRGPDELLAEAERRLGNGDEEELREACAALAEIAALRIRDAFAPEKAGA